VPVGAHETAETAVVLVLSGAVRVLDDARPGQYRVRMPGQGGAPQLDQWLANQRVLEAISAVQVPGITGASRAAARFMVGQVGAGARVVGLLGFPGHEAVLDVNLPTARAGAVHPVSRAGDLVV